MPPVSQLAHCLIGVEASAEIIVCVCSHVCTCLCLYTPISGNSPLPAFPSEQPLPLFLSSPTNHSVSYCCDIVGQQQGSRGCISPTQGSCFLVVARHVRTEGDELNSHVSNFLPFCLNSRRPKKWKSATFCVCVLGGGVPNMDWRVLMLYCGEVWMCVIQVLDVSGFVLTC